MFGKIIACMCCLLCGFPFFVIARCGRLSNEPINFWSGDKTLKAKVNDVKNYNIEMAELYTNFALALIVSAILCLLNLTIGLIGTGFCCTVGIYLVWRKYKKILGKYSKG